MKLNGKVTLITGGAGGIGTATALQLAGLGSDIMIIDQQIGSRAKAIKEQIESVIRHNSVQL